MIAVCFLLAIVTLVAVEPTTVPTTAVPTTTILELTTTAPSYLDEGCWRNKIPQKLDNLERTDKRLDKWNYKRRTDAINKCYMVAHDAGYDFFAIGNKGQCWAGFGDIYMNYGRSRSCPKSGKGKNGIVNVYMINKSEKADETTLPPTTLPPTTLPPATLPPTTLPPTTLPPTTLPLTTLPPTTLAATTLSPTTPEPTTPEPTTHEPTTPELTTPELTTPESTTTPTTTTTTTTTTTKPTTTRATFRCGRYTCYKDSHYCGGTFTDHCSDLKRSGKMCLYSKECRSKSCKWRWSSFAVVCA